MAEGLGWVGRCHFRYSMEPALCEHVGNTARTGGAIKKMMSRKSRNYTRLTRRRLVPRLLVLIRRGGTPDGREQHVMPFDNYPRLLFAVRRMQKSKN